MPRDRPIAMRRPLYAPTLRQLALLLPLGAVLLQASPPPTAGETRLIGGVTYEAVQVLKPTAGGLMIRHRGGLATVQPEELPPDWRARYGAQIEALAAAQARATPPPPAPARAQASQARPASAPSELARLLQQPPRLLPEMDLRPEFSAFGLSPKDQGRRPSCSIFAVLGALEYLKARQAGSPERYSEDYLIWATRETLRLTDEEVARRASAAGRGEDLGFSLLEVFQAVAAHGLATQAEMPNTYGSAMANIRPPSKELRAQASSRMQLRAIEIGGRTTDVALEKCVQALNQNHPVVIGMAVPPWRAVRDDTLLSEQAVDPVGGHAVTLVGYQNKTGRLEDTVFIFRNSWGRRWGSGGYGFATYAYLERNLNKAVVFELLGPPSAPSTPVGGKP